MKNLSAESRIIYYRLIALWAAAEGLLGGIVHSIQLPVSGIIVGGFAVICIALIRFFYPVKGAVIRATVLVCIFKMMLSPHSSVMAYIAVFFQGITGELILSRKGEKRLAVYVFAILAMLESALQRILVMTIIYGKKIWIAIDAFISGLTGAESVTRYSYIIAFGYVMMHILIALFISRFILKLRKQLVNHIEKPDRSAFLFEEKESAKRYPYFRLFYYFIYVILVILYIQSKTNPENAWFPAGTVTRLFIRSIFILLSWNLLLSPLLKMMLHRWLQKKKKDEQTELHAVLELLPATQLIIRHCWKKTSEIKGVQRIIIFVREVFIQSFAHARS
jgi:hypothetical protein